MSEKEILLAALKNWVRTVLPDAPNVDEVAEHLYSILMDEIENLQ